MMHLFWLQVAAHFVRVRAVPARQHFLAGRIKHTTDAEQKP